MNTMTNVEAVETKTRAAYAREYYAKNAEKLKEASRKSHAKANAEKKEAGMKLNNVIDTIMSFMTDEMKIMLDSGYENGYPQFEADIEFIKSKLCK